MRSDEIELRDSTLRFGRFTRRILEIKWLRPNVVRIHTQTKLRSQSDILVFYPSGSASFGIETQRRRRMFQRSLTQALTKYFGEPASRETLHSDKHHGIGGAYPRIFVGGRAIIGVDSDETSSVINGVMRAAIQWSAALRRRVSVVVPEGRRQTIAIRLQAMPALRERFDWLQCDGER